MSALGVTDKKELAYFRRGQGAKKRGQPKKSQQYCIAPRHEKLARNKVPQDESGMTAKERQEERNREYYARLAAGEIEEPPIPRLLNNQVRDSCFAATNVDRLTMSHMS